MRSNFKEREKCSEKDSVQKDSLRSCPRSNSHRRLRALELDRTRSTTLPDQS